MTFVADLKETFPDQLRKALGSFKPAPDTLKWTTTGAGGFIRGPVDQLQRCGYAFSGGAEDAFFSAIEQDYWRRGIDCWTPSNNAELLDPEFNGLAKNAQGYNTYDVMHFSIAAARDGAKAGRLGLATVGLQLVSSYFVSKNLKYLRCEDSDDPEKMYGTGGRLRIAPRCVQALVQAHDILESAPGPQGEAQRKLAIDLLLKHLARIKAAWPLTAAPKGDHLPVPHAEVFMLGHMYEAMAIADEKLRSLNAGLVTNNAIAAANWIMSRSQEMILQASLVGSGYPIGTFAYDLAVNKVGDYYIHPETLNASAGRRTVGIQSVNQWIYPAIKHTEAGKALREDAIKNGWPTKLPLVWIDRIQERLP